jgi:hypothetical protein
MIEILNKSITEPNEIFLDNTNEFITGETRIEISTKNCSGLSVYYDLTNLGSSDGVEFSFEVKDTDVSDDSFPISKVLSDGVSVSELKYKVSSLSKGKIAVPLSLNEESVVIIITQVLDSIAGSHNVDLGIGLNADNSFN